MEPNPLASPVPPGGGSPEWMAMTQTVASLPVERGSASGFSSPTSSAVADPPVRPATHANGHYANGHSNGHGAHWPALVTMTTPATYAQPIPTTAAGAESFYLRFGKRALDVAGALFGLAISSPLLLAAAIAIRIESRGPIFYRSIRVGRGGRPFTFLKLRSMVDGADRHRQKLTHLNESDGPVFKMARDPRVTRVGRFLRTTSIDEIPQLLNVLKGEMSLVGPRPPIPHEVAQYEPWQLRRLDVLPGITCLWQISGRSRIGFQEWMRLDLEYIKHQSFRLDMKILVRTIPAVLSREGAY
jgi:lipopolysaccharide/colanic/teichoic acid biosynthesis glycosyltransferase